ncbi:hypothetical protein ACFL9T_07480 [Thermodesulfobacteriota bacterium]
MKIEVGFKAVPLWIYILTGIFISVAMGEITARAENLSQVTFYVH